MFFPFSCNLGVETALLEALTGVDGPMASLKYGFAVLFISILSCDVNLLFYILV